MSLIGGQNTRVHATPVSTQCEECDMTFTKLRLKLAAMALLMAFLPFAGAFACPCDGKDDIYQPVPVQPGSGSTN